MRKGNPVDSLISPVKQSILAATYGQPDRWWYAAELAAFAERTPSSLQRDLTALAQKGLLRKRREGSRVYYKAETDSPLYEPLRLLIERSYGVVEALRAALEAMHDRIEVSFIYGSVARGDQNSQSDVDLLTIGGIGLSDIAPPMRRLEAKFRREFNVKCYSEVEFRKKLSERNHYVSSLLEGAKVFVIGDENVLGRLIGKRIR
jgi:predicted nucleotidyltransferase